MMDFMQLVMTQGTILTETSNSLPNGFKIETTGYFFDETVYYVTKINGKIVDFTDTSIKY